MSTSIFMVAALLENLVARRPEASPPSAWWLVRPLTARNLRTEAVHLVALLLQVFAKVLTRSCEGASAPSHLA